MLDYQDPESYRRQHVADKLRKWETHILIALACLVLLGAVLCGFLAFLVNQFQFGPG